MGMGPNGNDNHARAMDLVRQAAASGAQVICLPELYRWPYLCQKEDIALFDLAEPLDGPSVTDFRNLASELRVAVIVPFFERRGPGLYHNTAAVIDADGALLGLYRKMHIPDDPAYFEKYYFAPGDLGFRTFDTAFGRVAVLICWDQWYPEGARLAALSGATSLFYPTAIGWHPAEKEQYGALQRDAWTTVQRGHAVANGLYVAAPNRVGLERPYDDLAGIEFWGGSFIAGPQGELLAQAASDREESLVTEVDPAHLEEVRRNWPFFRDRRVDAYGGLTRRWLDGTAE
ncbi:MAG TPA: carbon-nitrogen hydrolase [Candidatus Hydrogenedentes bacterium]|nr:carbon-nitrogen hydrolase [Candidatus Hydrogenedentota bacterium]